MPDPTANASNKDAYLQHHQSQIGPCPIATELLLLNEDHPKPAYVNVSRTTCDGYQNLASVPAQSHWLKGHFPEIRNVLSLDAYASINSYFRPGHAYATHPDLARLTDPTKENTPLKKPLGNDGNRPLKRKLSRLNACFVDFDFYKTNLNKNYVLDELCIAQDNHKIPRPTYLKDSGRGLWAYWLLDANNAYPNELRLYEQIQRALTHSLRHLNADPNAIDAVRVSRITGSLNTKSNRIVKLFPIQLDLTGKPIRYTLQQLADALELPPSQTQTAPVTSSRPDVRPCNREKGFKGQRRRWGLDEERFWSLCEDIRKTVPRGLRHNHCFTLGCLYRFRYHSSSKLLEASITAAAARLHRLFEQPTTDPYPLSQIEDEIYRCAAGPKYRITHREIANRLAISPEEAETLRCKFNRKSSWPPSYRHPQLPRTKSRSERSMERRQWIAAQNPQTVSGMTTRKLAETLRAHGLGCSATTASKDRNAVLGRCPQKKVSTKAKTPPSCSCPVSKLEGEFRITDVLL
jgi:hypothetical protein